MLETAAAPEGFKPIKIPGGHIAHNGPYYYKNMENGDTHYGFMTDERHSNPNNVIHGGALFSFADTIIGNRVVRETRRYCATISMTTDFISSTNVDQWIEGRVRIKKLTRSMAFVDVEVSSGDKLLMSASAVFKLFDEI